MGGHRREGRLHPGGGGGPDRGLARGLARRPALAVESPTAHQELLVDVTPESVLAMWAGGVAAGAAAVAWWRIVGPGFVWLSGAVVLLFGLPAAIIGAGPVAWLGMGLASSTLGLAQRPRQAALSFAGAAVAYVAAAMIVGHPLLAVTGAVALGGVTSEMLLGHWYLVDPKLPRWALRWLAGAAGAGLIADAAALVVLGVLDWPEVDAVLGWAFVALAAMSALLIVGVWFALREPRYSGVMAATGLSYLAVLTVFGAAVTGRIVVS